MKSIYTALIMGSMLWGGSCFAEDLTGMVRVKGNAHFATVQLVKPGEQKGPRVCKNDVGSKIKRLSNLQIKLSGEWKNKDTKKSCFNAASFEVHTKSFLRAHVAAKVLRSAEARF